MRRLVLLVALALAPFAASAAPRNALGYRVRIDPAEGATGEAALAQWTQCLRPINAVVRDCALGGTLR